MPHDWWPAWWTVAVAVAALLLLWWRHHSLHFARLGLPHSTPVPMAGNMLGLVVRTKSLSEIVIDLYRRHEPHPYAGVFDFRNRVLMIRRPETVSAVTVKDFDHFTDHSPILGGESGSLLFAKSLFSLKGKKWHDTRATLSPAFTSMKMKNMFVFMCETAQQMVEYLKARTAEHAVTAREGALLSLEMKDFFTRIANDVIATTAFGLRVDSLSDPDNEFYKMGLKLVKIRVLHSLGYALCPKIMEMLDIPFMDREAGDFFTSVVHNTIKNREAKGIVRNDMLHLLMQARRGELTSEENEDFGNVGKAKVFLDDEDIAAQAMIFFFAGSDTVSTAVSFGSYALATHQDVQRRLQEEVDELMEKCGGRPTYEQVQHCQYLDMVVSETLRMYTPAVFLDRQCVQTYRLPSADGSPEVEVRPGDTLWVPVHGFHYDERYFPDPECFDPERFSHENKHRIKPFTYFPFGIGPRFCIAQRFALLEIKVILLYLMSQFSLQVVPKTTIPLKLNSNGLELSMKGGTWLGVIRRKE